MIVNYQGEVIGQARKNRLGSRYKTPQQTAEILESVC